MWRGLFFGVILLSERLYALFLKLPLLIRLLLITSIILIIFGVSVHYLEPQNFPTIFDGVWWAVITASTVGYGDFVPKTAAGRVSGILLIFIGASFLTFYFSHLSAAAVKKQNEFIEGKSDFKGMGHLIIIGWNERSRKMISAICKKANPNQIILIDETLDKFSVENTNVHFIRGKASNDDTLIKANLAGADCVIITADPNKDEMLADIHTIVTLLAVKGINPAVTCIVEILTSEQIKNASRAGADEIIRTNLLISTELLQSYQIKRGDSAN